MLLGQNGIQAWHNLPQTNGSGLPPSWTPMKAARAARTTVRFIGAFFIQPRSLILCKRTKTTSPKPSPVGQPISRHGKPRMKCASQQVKARLVNHHSYFRISSNSSAPHISPPLKSKAPGTRTSSERKRRLQGETGEVDGSTLLLGSGGASLKALRKEAYRASRW